MIFKMGYCAVTADFLHIGHINFIMSCKEKCETLTVGIMSDDCVLSYKGKKPIMNQVDRERIIKSLRFVNNTIIQNTFEFPHSIVRAKEFWDGDFIIFDGEEHSREHADVIIPRTQGVSSSIYKGQDDYFNLSKHSL